MRRTPHPHVSNMFVHTESLLYCRSAAQQQTEQRVCHNAVKADAGVSNAHWLHVGIGCTPNNPVCTLESSDAQIAPHYHAQANLHVIHSCVYDFAGAGMVAVNAQGSGDNNATGSAASMAAPADSQRPAKRQKAARKAQVDEAQRLAVLAAVDAVLAGGSAGNALEPAGSGGRQHSPAHAEPASLTPQQNGTSSAVQRQSPDSWSPAQLSAQPQAPTERLSHQTGSASPCAAADQPLSDPRDGASLPASDSAAAGVNAQQADHAALQHPAEYQDAAAPQHEGPGARAILHAALQQSTPQEAAKAAEAPAPVASQHMQQSAAAPAHSDSSATQADDDAAAESSDAGCISSDGAISDVDMPAPRPPLRKVKNKICCLGRALSLRQRRPDNLHADWLTTYESASCPRRPI